MQCELFLTLSLFVEKEKPCLKKRIINLFDEYRVMRINIYDRKLNKAKGDEPVTRLCCAECGKVVEYHEEVCLDILNSVMHKDCYALQYALKDFGSFRYIVDKYGFFETLR